MWQHIRMRYLDIDKDLDEVGLINKISLQWIEEKTGRTEVISSIKCNPSITNKEADSITLQEFIISSPCTSSKGSAPSTVLKPPA